MEEGYQALREGAAWLDLSGRGKIVVRGEDRTRLLHALCTNHIQDLRPGQGCYAFFLDAQGHILADAHVFCFEDRFVVDSEPETASKLYAHLDRYIIADDVTLEEATAHLATVALEGPHAAAVLKSLGAPVPAAPFAHAAWGTYVVARASYTGGEGFFVMLPLAEKAALIEALGRAGAATVNTGAATAVRLEQGKPRYGEDITEQHLPQETQQLHAIHFSKGCYLGQEIVERIRSRGHVNRLLVRLLLEAEAAPQRGVVVLASGAPVGEVTSAAFSPAVGKVIALAYVRAGHAAPGTVLECAGGTARVISLTGDPRAELVQHALRD